MYFYFRLIPNFNYGRLKKIQQMIQFFNKQMHKSIYRKQISKNGKDYKHTYCLKKNQSLSLCLANENIL